MQVVFRADASLQIGTGHVMRCLTLADILAARGAVCHFICREHSGNLIGFILGKGHQVHVLPIVPTAVTGLSGRDLYTPADDLTHSHWLGATQAQDAETCISILAELQPDWLIVDHYALDNRWEQVVKLHCRKLMVIDDLVDRPHDCDLLLDQTFGRVEDEYRARVPAHCHVLCGSLYALLRPEFSALRPYSLQRRIRPKLKQLLITMGGVDKDNATGEVLAALHGCGLPKDCEITLVMGITAPWLSEIQQQAQAMPWQTHVRVGVTNMAQLMADSDLAIGAAGATSWERCCLGLPTAMMVLADNQKYTATLLEQADAARVLQRNTQLPTQFSVLINEMIQSEACLRRLGDRAQAITDGEGAQKVTDYLLAGIVNE